MFFSETLRKYPALPFLDRTCNKRYQIPGTDVIIEKGVVLYISMLGLHYDPKYFPEPETFNPDRFAGNSENIVPYSYLPFGLGPRNCIGKNKKFKKRIASTDFFLQGKGSASLILKSE